MIQHRNRPILRVGRPRSKRTPPMPVPMGSVQAQILTKLSRSSTYVVFPQIKWHQVRRGSIIRSRAQVVQTRFLMSVCLWLHFVVHFAVHSCTPYAAQQCRIANVILMYTKMIPRVHDESRRNGHRLWTMAVAPSIIAATFQMSQTMTQLQSF